MLRVQSMPLTSISLGQSPAVGHSVEAVERVGKDRTTLSSAQGGVVSKSLRLDGTFTTVRLMSTSQRYLKF
jgi:hypothetical protein